MALRQISVFAENKKGTLLKATAAIAAAGVDLKSATVADTAEFGIFRFLTTDADMAVKALKNVGLRVSTRSITAVAVPNAPGELNRVLEILNDAGINIEYMYSIVGNAKDEAFMAIRVDDNNEADSLLTEHGYRLLNETDL